MTIKYPFYCIDEVDTREAAKFMRDHLQVVYGWTIDEQIRGGCLSHSFFESKMHVFTIITNKGFRI